MNTKNPRGWCKYWIAPLLVKKKLWVIRFQQFHLKKKKLSGSDAKRVEVNGFWWQAWLKILKVQDRNVWVSTPFVYAVRFFKGRPPKKKMNQPTTCFNSFCWHRRFTTNGWFLFTLPPKIKATHSTSQTVGISTPRWIRFRPPGKNGENENRRLFSKSPRTLLGLGGLPGLNRDTPRFRAQGLEKLHHHTRVFLGQHMHLAKVPKWQPGRKYGNVLKKRAWI